MADKSGYTNVSPKGNKIELGKSGMKNTDYSTEALALDTPRKDRAAIEKANSPSGRAKAPGSTRT